ncbi:glycosyl hydrolase family 28-related protein [Ideonella sp. DXS29W]|uniref:Glycosyl hydrolase family 28-related protein n=1 Tax=Ideonella lacteola TaxID=2984193 RepID=A0ABU9BSS9_9BURK
MSQPSRALVGQLSVVCGVACGVAFGAVHAAAGDPPVILNAPASAKPGDIVGLQGEGFGAAAVVWLDPSPTSLTSLPSRNGIAARSLPVLNRVGTGWVAVQIPPDATGALWLRVARGGLSSEPVAVNAAKPFHLEALEIVPGTVFRVFGRSLKLPGSTPRVTVDGLAAEVDMAQSHEQMLVVRAPDGLRATDSARLLIDNGNGTGAARLDRPVRVVRSGHGDPFGLGVGWAAAFSHLTRTVVDAATDTRLPVRVACDGQVDDAAAIQAAVDLAATLGGGVVQLPAGTCRLAGGFGLRSRVVVQGRSMAQTVLRYESDYPFWGTQLDLTGVRRLTLRQAGSASQAASLVQSSRVVVQQVRFELTRSRQLFFTDNRQAAFVGNQFIQTGSVDEQGAFVMNGSSGLAFLDNTVQFVNGASSFRRVHDAWLQGNHFTRDARQQTSPGIVHAMVLDFAHRVAVVGNTFDVAHGPITQRQRNDGETILTEGGGAGRTENLGQVESATRHTLRDPANVLNVDPFGEGAIPENYGVAIVAGRGMGQTRRVTAYADATLTVDAPWSVVPDASSRYATFVWGLEKSLIRGNTLSQNPRGIWLYQAAVREVDVVGNHISEGGGIYLRSYQNLANQAFDPIYDVRIQDNRIRNTTAQWTSALNTMFINADARAFGTGLLGIEVRDNRLRANQPNLSLPTEEYAGTEGFTNMMRVEDYSRFEPMATPRVLGTVYQRNQCSHCDVAVRLGTGVGGTVIADTILRDTGTLWTNSLITDLSDDVATDTLVLR